MAMPNDPERELRAKLERLAGDDIDWLVVAAGALDKAPEMIKKLILEAADDDKACKMVQKLIERAAAPGGHISSAPAYKKADERYQRFWEELATVKLDEAKCLKLPEDVCWFGTKELGSLVVVRDCYCQFWSKIVTECNRNNGVIVSGTRGIGKTLGLGGYILWIARAQGFSVLHHQAESSVFLYTYDKDGAAVVHDAATEKELEDAMINKKAEVYYICDGVKPCRTTGFPTILISSPAPDILKTFGQQHNTLFMDIWSVEELDILKQHYPTLRDDVYEELLEWYGPVPRWCLEQTKKSLNHNILRKAADDAILRRDLVKALCCNHEMSVNDRVISHLLVHLRPKEDMLTVVYQIATPYVAGKMMEVALKERKADFLTMMSCYAALPGCTHVYGTLFEFYFLKVFLKGGRFDCKHFPGQPSVMLPASSYLVKEDNDEQDMKYTFTIPTTRDFDFVDLKMVDKFKPATLYYKKQSVRRFASLAAADAILTPTEQGQPAFLIQVTAGKKKDALSKDGVKAVQDFLRRGNSVWGESVPLVIMYVVPPETYAEFNTRPTDNYEDSSTPKKKLPRLILEFPVGMKDLCNAPTSSPETSPGTKRLKVERVPPENTQAELEGAQAELEAAQARLEAARVLVERLQKQMQSPGAQ